MPHIRHLIHAYMASSLTQCAAVSTILLVSTDPPHRCLQAPSASLWPAEAIQGQEPGGSTASRGAICCGPPNTDGSEKGSPQRENAVEIVKK